jgi:hypothetical protein
VEKRALSLEQLRHEQAKRFREKNQDAEEYGDLENSYARHVALKTSPDAATPSSNTPAETALQFLKAHNP